MASLLLRGFALGFAIAASPGPLFFLCLRRTLSGGGRLGLVSGLGVATADGIYAAIAAFGVAAISSILVSERRWLALAGAAALVVIAARTLVSRPRDVAVADPADDTSQARARAFASAYFSTLGLTLTNPSTILAFTAVFTSLGLGLQTRGATAVSVVAGVALGSASWWVLLAALATRLRARITPGLVKAIGTAAGLAILALALLVIASTLTGR